MNPNEPIDFVMKIRQPRYFFNALKSLVIDDNFNPTQIARINLSSEGIEIISANKVDETSARVSFSSTNVFCVDPTTHLVDLASILDGVRYHVCREITIYHIVGTQQLCFSLKDQFGVSTLLPLVFLQGDDDDHLFPLCVISDVSGSLKHTDLMHIIRDTEKQLQDLKTFRRRLMENPDAKMITGDPYKAWVQLSDDKRANMRSKVKVTSLREFLIMEKMSTRWSMPWMIWNPVVRKVYPKALETAYTLGCTARLSHLQCPWRFLLLNFTTPDKLGQVEFLLPNGL